MATRVLLTRVRRAIDRIDALDLDQTGFVDVDPIAIIDALREVRKDLDDALALPASFADRDLDWEPGDNRQCGRVAHLI